MSNKNWRFETKQLHVGQEQADPVTDSRAVPIYASTSFVFHNSQHAADRSVHTLDFVLSYRIFLSSLFLWNYYDLYYSTFFRFVNTFLKNFL